MAQPLVVQLEANVDDEEESDQCALTEELVTVGDGKGKVAQEKEKSYDKQEGSRDVVDGGVLAGVTEGVA